MFWRSRAASLSSYAVGGGLLLAALTGSAFAGGMLPKARMTAVEVEIQVFSGRPNPRWTLSDADIAALRSKLSGLRKGGPGPRPGNLGYGGVTVRVTRGDDWTLHVHDGLAEAKRGARTDFLLDRQRALERWLVATGRTLLSPEVRKVVDADLQH
jgi:hypothetical protein